MGRGKRYQPEQVVHKLPGGQPHLALPLLPTAKIIDEVQAAHPGLYVIPFHYEADISPAQLLVAATARLDRFSCVVESRGAESTPGASEAKIGSSRSTAPSGPPIIRQ